MQHKQGCLQATAKQQVVVQNKLTCAATLYSSTRGSFVRWICSGSSVLRLTFIPLAKKVGNGLRW